MTSAAAVLRVSAAKLDFQNPVLLAAGTAAYGRELSSVVDLDALGGIVTKAVSPEPRKGAAAPRVAEFEGGMINAVGLANPGLESVKREDLPWLAENVRLARVMVNVVGSAVEDFSTVVESLDRVAAGGCVRAQRELSERSCGWNGIRCRHRNAFDAREQGEGSDHEATVREALAHASRDSGYALALQCSPVPMGSR